MNADSVAVGLSYCFTPIFITLEDATREAFCNIGWDKRRFSKRLVVLKEEKLPGPVGMYSWLLRKVRVESEVNGTEFQK